MRFLVHVHSDEGATEKRARVHITDKEFGLYTVRAFVSINNGVFSIKKKNPLVCTALGCLVLRVPVFLQRFYASKAQALTTQRTFIRARKHTHKKNTYLYYHHR